ncbi:hypothetical protein GOBAR_AA37971 [Gossypium barbadense]|uniref:Ionotropic glutamate receptor C-terminal domain-containing protein n=1 Tax=Gossypium barbadense TaxID=3634 RepID=A0A2P5VV69_GOSBA|nr:hypothetical protein GOBAR_AA37971 [Gossypium barbadense]
MDNSFCYHAKAQNPRPRCIFFASRVLKLWLFFFVFICLLVLSNGEETTNANKLIKIGAIIDINSRTGREEKTALDVAAQSFNNNDSNNHKLSLHIQDSGRNPLLAATVARKLIKEQEVEVIIGLETWEEAVVVGDIGSRAQVPVFSFAAPAITPPLATTRWPFLVRMANEDSKKMKCIAAIIGLFNWKRVIVIYEDDVFGSESGKLALLPEALQDVGSEVEFRLVLPPFSSVTNLNVAVHEVLKKLQKKQSRAKKSGLVGHDSAWIVTETISSYLDSFNSSVISSMEGTLGIKIYYSEDTSLYKKFYTNFRTTFRNEYHEEDNSQPGINAFRAYDSIGIITQAVEKLKKYKELDFWLPGIGFSRNPTVKNETGYVGEISQDLGGRVYWPGDSKLAPKGWAMPTDEKPSIIGVPAITSFEKFVKVVDGKLPGVKNYDGFCIKLFYEVLKVLGYHLPYHFDPHNGTYDELVNKVYNKKLKSDGKSPKKLLKKILSSNFTGASGEVCFEEEQLSYDPILRIVNVVGKRYKELDFWLPGIGFSRNPGVKNETVNWPGDSKLVPKGWAIPTDEKPLIIGVPAITSFEKFVKVVDGKLPGVKNYDGFCIKLFYEVLKVLGYHLPYHFDPHNGTYDELVNKVYNKTYDAAIGDITILADRADHVEFTQPYAESGLSMIVPAKSEDSAWIFVKPFTIEMWLVTAAILIYTMFIVWVLEHQSNPEFRGPWNHQIGTAIWFAFSSLFFAHREKVYSNLIRMVVVVWLFVVLVLNSSYTASLTSILTVKRLGPNVTDIELLKRANLKIRCDGDSFVRTYLEKVLNFKSYNIENVSSEYKYEGEFKSHRIAAAFLELPYGKVFLSHYCKQFTTSTPTYRFGGLGFVFQKGSPIAKDFSRAILQFSENGFLLSLEKEWFSPSLECSADVTDSSTTDSLSIRSFWGLYLISGATSTLCFLFFSMRLLKKYYRHRVDNVDESVWIKAIQVAKYFYLGDVVLVQWEASVAPDL